jgi:molybdate transport system substrate-binding protein
MILRLLTAMLMLLGSSLATAQPTPTVAAASDLKFALEEIAKEYQRTTGKQVKLTFGSSGNFLRQIQQGAPFDMFMSADEAFVDKLAEEGLAADKGTLYAVGRIVLFTPKGSTVMPDDKLADLAAALKDGRMKKFAIANPEHAPYGRAAQEALTSLGLWQGVQPLLVLGENVSQAAQFAASGSTQGGIFALSLAISPAFSDAGTYAILPESLHKPIRQKMVVLKRGESSARGFYDYLQQPAARAVLRRYGFVLPGE